MVDFGLHFKDISIVVTNSNIFFLLLVINNYFKYCLLTRVETSCCSLSIHSIHPSTHSLLSKQLQFKHLSIINLLIIQNALCVLYLFNITSNMQQFEPHSHHKCISIFDTTLSRTRKFNRKFIKKKFFFLSFHSQ